MITIPKTKNTTKYYLYQFFYGLGFFAPVIVLFWKERGLSMTQIMLLQSIYSIGVVILEVPTGVIADRYGQKKSLVLGSLFFTIGLLVYSVSFKFWQLVVGELIISAAAAFISGSDKAFIHKALKSNNKEKDYKKVEGRARSLNNVSNTIANLLSGVIASISLGATLIASAVATFINFLISLSFTENKEISVERKEETNYKKIIGEGFSLIRENTDVLFFILLFAFFNGIVWTGNWLIQPYLQQLNVPVFYFGFIFAGLTVISSVFSAFTEKIDQYFGNSFLVLLGVTTLVLFLLGSLSSIYLLPLLSVFYVAKIVNSTLMSDKILKAVPPGNSSTILSFMSLVRRGIYALFGPILGFVSDRFGIMQAFRFEALILLVLVGSVLLIQSKINNEKRVQVSQKGQIHK